MERIRCAVLGLADEGRILYEAVRAQHELELIAIGDPSDSGLERAAQEAGAEAFRDCRLLLVETNPAVVFVGLPAYQAVEYLPIAAERGVAVFQLSPWAPDFESAAGAVGRFERGGSAHVIARPWILEPAYERLADLAELVGRMHVVDVSVHSDIRGREGWRGDAQRAGGGVLFQDAYEQLDIMVRVCGVPAQVYAAAGWVPGPGEVRPYDTEDAMAVLCRYSEDRLATITTCRTAGPFDWSITFRGARANAQVTPHRLRVSGPNQAKLVDRRVRSRNRYTAEVAAFVAALGDGSGRPSSTSRDHLATMAVMQAAYLSAKTGQPESPGKFLELARQ